MATNTDRVRTAASRARTFVSRGLDGLERAPAMTGRLSEALSFVTPLGRTVAVLGILAWVAGWRLGWKELMVVAGGCFILLVFAALFVVGRSTLRVDLVLEPNRVVEGDPSAGQLNIKNALSRRTLPLRVELPVGQGLAVFDVGSLGPGVTTEELLVVPTERRGVIPIGPATSVRGDPLGLLHRQTPSSPPYELIVHPKTVPLDPFGSGLLRDLEGLTTKDLSVSDLAFHALREYAPGDDYRHIHWRSSARANRLLVRQFQDTRRSTLCVVVDGRPTSYGDPEEFETAMQVAGSVALRACRDELSATVVAGNSAAAGSLPHVLLDSLSRAELYETSPGLPQLVGRAMTHGGDVSFGILISGSATTLSDVQHAASRFPVEVRVVAVRIVPGQRAGLRAGGRAVLVDLPSLAELPAVMRTELAR